MLDPQAATRAAFWIAGVVALALGLLVGGFRWEADSLGLYEASAPLPRTVQSLSVERAVFAQDRLWLLTSAGEIWTVDKNTPAASRTASPEPAVELCADGDTLVAVTTPAGSPATYTVRRRVGSDWQAIAAVPSRNEGLVGVQCPADGIVLVTAQRLLDIRPGGGRSLALSHRIPSGYVNVLHLTPTHVFVGVNAGEWGGGLHRIDRRTGQVALLERNARGDLCGGPLNGACDPVNGLAERPGKPGCIVAAVGLVHMRSRGRLVEVCGEQIKPLYLQPCPRAWDPDGSIDKHGEPFCSIAFFGLGRRGDVLFAMGVDGLHVIEGESARKRQLPKFQAYGPFRVSFDAPEAVLVLTDVNQRTSVSGMTPLMAMRSPGTH